MTLVFEIMKHTHPMI